MAAFILSVIVRCYSEGQRACTQAGRLQSGPVSMARHMSGLCVGRLR